MVSTTLSATVGVLGIFSLCYEMIKNEHDFVIRIFVYLIWFHCIQASIAITNLVGNLLGFNPSS